MATYYKYAERGADSQVDWGLVGRNVTDMLKTEADLREKNKAAYQDAFNVDMEKLSNAPQGKWQDGNKVVNDFAHDMMNQQLIDNRLLKSGQMKPRDYTLRRDNYVSQTKTLFDLQKLFQQERQATLEDYQNKKIQGFNISNMQDVEGYTDFANSKAIIDPYSSNINMAKMETKIIDGKEVRVASSTVSPVNVLRGQIIQKIPTFAVEDAMDNTVKGLGDRVNVLYDIATKTKAGTITKLTGIGALEGEAAKNPIFKAEITKFNSAIDKTIDSYFANPYNLTSVLTENVGTYGPESFTWNKEEAKKDPTKILKKVDSFTGLATIDENAPHFKAQEKEARDWVRNQLLAKLDAKKEMVETGTTPYGPQPQQWMTEVADQRRKDLLVASKAGDLYSGSAASVQGALSFFKGINPAIQNINKTGDAIVVQYVNPYGKTVEEPIRFKAANGSSVMSKQQFIESVTPLLSGAINTRAGAVSGGVFNPQAAQGPASIPVNQPVGQQNPFSLIPQGYTPPIPTEVNTSGVGAKYN